MRILVSTMLVFVSLFLVSCAKNSTDNQMVLPTSGEVPGFQYLLTETFRIYEYNNADGTLTQLVSETDSILSFAASGDGAFLAYLTRSGSLKVWDVSTARLNTFAPPLRPANRISIDKDGTIIAFDGVQNNQYFIYLFLTEPETFFVWQTDSGANARYPLFSPLGNLLAWVQDNGVFIKALEPPGEQPIQLSAIWQFPQVFSRLGTYLTTSRGTFDVKNLVALSPNINGKVKYIDDFHLIYQPAGSYSLILTDALGVNSVQLLAPVNQPFPFEVDPSGAFLSYVPPSGASDTLRIISISVNRLMKEEVLPTSQTGKIREIIWRDKPLIR